MRRTLVTIAAVALSILLVAGLAACGRSGGGLDDFKQLLSDAQATDSLPAFAERVYLVLPEKCGAEVSAGADELKTAINGKTGVDTMIKYDNEELLYPEGTLVIYVGYTDNAHSREVLHDLKADMYVCRWDIDSIVIGGRSEKATVEALAVFTERVQVTSTRECLFVKDQSIASKTEHTVESATLNGYDLYDYTIAYGESDTARDMARDLRDYLALRLGYYLNLIPMSKIDEAVGKCIVIDLGSTADGASLACRDRDVLLSGGTDYELSCAVAELAERFAPSGNSAAASVGELERVACSRESIVVSIASLENGGVKNIDQIADLSSRIDNGGSDIILFNAIDPDTLGYMKLNLKSTHTLVTVTGGDGNSYPIVYRNAAFSSVSCRLVGAVVVVETVTVSGEKRDFVRSLDGDPDAISAIGIDKEAYYLFASSCDSSWQMNEINGVHVDRFALADGGHDVLLDARFCFDESLREASSLDGDGFCTVFTTVRTELRVCEEYYELQNSVN